jgi:hypothetical protein
MKIKIPGGKLDEGKFFFKVSWVALKLPHPRPKQTSVSALTEYLLHNDKFIVMQGRDSPNS